MEALILNHTITPKPSYPKVLFFRSPLIHSNFKPTFSPRSSRFHSSYTKRTFSFTTTCRLNTPQGNKKNDGNITKKIILTDEVPPPLAEGSGGANESEEVAGKTRKSNGVMRLVKRFPRKVLSVLSNLPLAIGEMFAVAALMALGMLDSYPHL